MIWKSNQPMGDTIVVNAAYPRQLEALYFTTFHYML